MSTHVSKNMKNLLEKLRKFGFSIQINGNCVKVVPPENMKIPMYIAHYGEKGYHPVRRYVKNKCGLSVD